MKNDQSVPFRKRHGRSALRSLALAGGFGVASLGAAGVVNPDGILAVSSAEDLNAAMQTAGATASWVAGGTIVTGSGTILILR